MSEVYVIRSVGRAGQPWAIVYQDSGRVVVGTHDHQHKLDAEKERMRIIVQESS